MARRPGLLIAVAMLSLAGCAQPARPHANPVAGRVAAVDREAASSRAMGGQDATVWPSPDAAGRAWPAGAAEPSPSPEAQAVASPTATPTPAAAATPTPTPKPGPDEPYAFVYAFAPECEVLLRTVPALPQLRNLTCETAAMRMVLAARGIEASEEDILARMPRSENPHQGFRGEPDGNGHDPELRDYGVYAEVVAQVLQSFGVPAEAVQGMSDWQLRQAVRGGKAVIVWVTAEENPKVIRREGYRLVEGEHVYVVVGLLNDGRLLVHDPWGVRADSGRAGTFPVWTIRQWDLFDRQAVVVPLS